MSMNEVPCENCSCRCMGCSWGPCMCWLNGSYDENCNDCEPECERALKDDGDYSTQVEE